MSKLLDEAFEKMKALPEQRQDELARLLIELAADEPLQLTPEQEAEVAISRAQAARGEFATEEEVREMWRRFGL
jgi:predicted transcriptional regulator